MNLLGNLSWSAIPFDQPIVMFATACCARIMIASVKPRSSMSSASTIYMTPMRLWSTDVIHSRHR